MPADRPRSVGYVVPLLVLGGPVPFLPSIILISPPLRGSPVSNAPRKLDALRAHSTTRPVVVHGAVHCLDHAIIWVAWGARRMSRRPPAVLDQVLRLSMARVGSASISTRAGRWARSAFWSGHRQVVDDEVGQVDVLAGAGLEVMRRWQASPSPPKDTCSSGRERLRRRKRHGAPVDDGRRGY